MTEVEVMALTRHMLWTAILLGGPVLALGLAVGLLVGVVQAATQIQEASLTFVPKVGALVALMFFGGAWALDKMVAFADGALNQLAFMSPGQLG